VQEAPETAAVSAEREPESTPIPAHAKGEQPTKDPNTTNAPAVESKSETEKTLAQVTDSFEPPFPDRVELFVAPKRQGRGVKKSADGFDNAVELLGFVNVDGQRVVLSINGFVLPLAEGSQEAGVEVISIQPPAAVLQRGRQRWQVNLE